MGGRSESISDADAFPSGGAEARLAGPRNQAAGFSCLHGMAGRSLAATAQPQDFLIPRAGWLSLSRLVGVSHLGCPKSCHSNHRWARRLLCNYPSKEGALGHSEVAVINLSDAR